MDRGAWWATVYGGHKELDMNEQLIFSRLKKKKKHMRGSSMESAKKKNPFHP